MTRDIAAEDLEARLEFHLTIARATGNAAIIAPGAMPSSFHKVAPASSAAVHHFLFLRSCLAIGVMALHGSLTRLSERLTFSIERARTEKRRLSGGFRPFAIRTTDVRIP